jgi:coproporphyrinogen III oxidase
MAALELVESLQRHFVTSLEALDAPLARVEWLRDEGRHGGGVRFGAAETMLFNRASVNVSQVQYDDELTRALGSATALSTIIHPRHPRAPSVHAHFSYTEPRGGRGTWRLMADLNPALPDTAQTHRFADALAQAAPTLALEARERGDRYFFIPALGRHRGATHFYVEAFDSGDFEADLEPVQRVASAALGTWMALLRESPREPASELERAEQLAYHTLYLLQVLTLDRGTTTGLLAHDQNDVGTMGSLPSFVNKRLLESWSARLPKPQDELLDAIIATLPGVDVAQVNDAVRAALASVVRAHYREHPEALALQASGEPSRSP